MSLISRLFLPKKEQRASSSNLTAFVQWMDTLLTGKTSKSGVDVNVETAVSAATVLCALKVLAESVASLPLITYARLPDGSKKKLVNHPLFKLLRYRPNVWQTPFEFKEYMMVALVLYGNFYARKLFRRNGELKEIRPIHPLRIRRELGRNKIIYLFKDSQGATVELSSRDVFDIRGLSTDGLNGLSPLDSNVEVIGLTLALEQFGARFFRNGAVMSGVLEHPGELTEEGIKKLRESFKEAYAGSNAHNTLILEEGMKWQPTAADPSKAQMLETRKFQLLEVARIMRVPPHMLMDLSRANFNNIATQSQEFVTYTLLPWFTRIEESIVRDLVAEREQNTVFSMFKVGIYLRGDPKTRFETYRIGRQWGILTANEAREQEDLDPRDDGDNLLIPQNMIPADRVDELGGKTKSTKKVPEGPMEVQEGASSVPIEYRRQDLVLLDEVYRSWLDEIRDRLFTKEVKFFQAIVRQKAWGSYTVFVRKMDEFFDKERKYAYMLLTRAFCAYFDIYHADRGESSAADVLERFLDKYLLVFRQHCIDPFIETEETWHNRKAEMIQTIDNFLSEQRVIFVSDLMRCVHEEGGCNHAVA